MRAIRRSLIGAVVISLGALLTSGRASAIVTNFHYHKWIVSGQKGLLGTSSDLDLNCRVIRITPPTILSPPQHGSLLFARSSNFLKFNIQNPHYKCSFNKVPGIRVYYRSRPAFIGTDQFTIEELARDGDVNISTFDITVQ